MTSRSAADLVAHLTELQDRIHALERSARTPQLPHSALGPGQYIGGVDEEGRQVARIGWQPDGGFTLRPEPGSGEPPPMPSAPLLTPSTGGLRVVWDGRLVDETGEDVVRPSDLAHVAVEVSTGVEWTRVGTITEAGDGGMLPVVPLPYVEHSVRLVAVTTSAVEGPPSAVSAATPLQVTGPDLAAGAVLAGHISAGAVEADKLAAILVLVSRIVAGDPAGARVEMNSTGFRAYSSTGILTVAVDAETGDAVYTGTITGSQIVGSSVLVGDEAADHIWIGEGQYATAHVVRARGGGAQVEIAATAEAADVRLTPPPHAGEDFQEGVQYAYVAVGPGFVYPAVAYTSPSSELILPRGATAEVQLEGASTTVDASRVRHRADVHHFSMGGWSSYLNGVIEVDPALSIRAPAHAPRMVSLVAQPTGSGNNGTWTDFAPGEFERLTWRTGYSGRVDFRITMCGINNSTPGATLSLGFRLTSSTEPDVPPGLSRAAMVRARAYPSASPNSYGEQNQLVVPLQLAPNVEYTLIPCWRASGASATWGTGATDALKFDAAYANTIEIINTM